MNPATHSRLYGPAPRPRTRNALVLLPAAAAWGLAGASAAWLLIHFGMAALWGLAAGADTGGLVAQVLLSFLGGAVVLGGIAFAPGVRRLSVETRLLLTGVVAFPVPTALAAMTLVNAG
ncbi:hypothetical protein [Streptomyces sp. KLOTTS4A1]|uniref:hypothetical protein n=1 Tax=Streptomyces sp. KLOTTS4A1 TaxID=3390996 RepID=UPI0039F578CA